MTEAHRDNSPSPSDFISRNNDYDHEPTSHRHHSPGLALPPMRQSRFPGDGLDFRRPIMSTGGSSAAPTDSVVIDLTDGDDSQDTASQTTVPASDTATAGSSHAQRLSRHQRNTTDVPSDQQRSRQHGSHALLEQARAAQHAARRRRQQRVHPQFSILRRPSHRAPTDMDDLEFVEARPRSRPPTVSRSHTPHTTSQRSVTPYPASVHDSIDLTGENDDDVVHIDTRARAGAYAERPNSPPHVGPRNFAERHTLTDLLNGHFIGDRLMRRLGWDRDVHLAEHRRLHNRHHEHTQRQPHIPARYRPPPERTNHSRLRWLPHPGAMEGGGGPAGIIADVMMDYDVTGFDMGMPGGNRPPTPKYSPPPDVQPGFTRSPGEDDIVVCPNCGDELAIGDSEVKQEVWVIKSCGHVSLLSEMLMNASQATDYLIGILRRLHTESREGQHSERRRCEGLEKGQRPSRGFKGNRRPLQALCCRWMQRTC